MERIKEIQDLFEVRWVGNWEFNRLMCDPRFRIYVEDGKIKYQISGEDVFIYDGD